MADAIPASVRQLLVAIDTYRRAKAYVLGTGTSAWETDLKESYEPTSIPAPSGFDPANPRSTGSQRFGANGYKLEVNYRATYIDPDPWAAFETAQPVANTTKREAWPRTSAELADLIKRAKEDTSETLDKSGPWLNGFALADAFRRARLHGKQGVEDFVRQAQEELRLHEVYFKDLEAALMMRQVGADGYPAET